jgi:hypothetical protein
MARTIRKARIIYIDNEDVKKFMKDETKPNTIKTTHHTSTPSNQKTALHCIIL